MTRKAAMHVLVLVTSSCTNDEEGPDLCDPFAQDCPEGFSCFPDASEGSPFADRNVCRPLVDDPVALGEPCTTDGDVDPCDVGTICLGTCEEVCGGSPEHPECSDPTHACASYNAGVIATCQTPCDPVAQDCSGSAACTMNGGCTGGGCNYDDLTFGCHPDSSELPDVDGAPCNGQAQCGAGLICAAPSQLSACDATIGCCTAYCYVDANEPCARAAAGEHCEPLFSEDRIPESLRRIGRCILPP